MPQQGKKRKSFSTASYFPLSAHDALPLTLENRLRDIAIYRYIFILKFQQIELRK